MSNKIKYIAVGCASAVIVGFGVSHHMSKNVAYNNDMTQIKTLKTTIQQTKDANDKLAISVPDNQKNLSGPEKLKLTQSNMQHASDFVLNYIKSMEKAKSTNDMKAINKTYLTSSAQLPIIVGGGDDGKISNVIFGNDINAIKTYASLPDKNGNIVVIATSDKSQKVGFEATYDQSSGRISSTKTYDLAGGNK